MTKSDLVHLRVVLEAFTGLDEVHDRIGCAREFEVHPNELAKAAGLLAMMGEAARNISPAFQAVHPEIPWGQMARVHARLVNHHFGVDYEAVWATIEQDLPALEPKVRAALAMADAWWGGRKGPSSGDLSRPSRSARAGP